MSEPDDHRDEKVDYNIELAPQGVSTSMSYLSRMRSPSVITSQEDRTEEIIDVGDDEDARQSSPLLNKELYSPNTFGLNTHFYQSSQRKKLNEALLFQLSGLIGSVLFLILYEIMSFAFKNLLYGGTISWFTSYTISIYLQFELNRFIVFGKDRMRDQYWSALRTTFAVYSIAMIVSTLFNLLLLDFFLMNRHAAWLITALLVGVMNYFALSTALKV
ncbi:COL12A1 [Acrasis kona]|uniref:COL12A1 n=1 Tax=Acrasis kona TaxID=1008807 RepID=A0AAW2ZRA0_9EUKA